MGDGKSFRGRLFGGFDRDDVVNYVSGLAKERSGYKEENEKLRERVDALEAELEEARRKSEAYRVSALDEAQENLDRLRREYGDVKNDINVTAKHIGEELNRISGSLSLLGTVLDGAQARLDCLDVTKNQ